MPLESTTTMSGAVGRLRSKVTAAVNSGDYYHAHQLYRTLNFRLGSQGRWDELIELLYEGITILVDHEQYTSAFDLSLQLLAALKDGKIECDRRDVLERLGDIFKRLHPSKLVTSKELPSKVPEIEHQMEVLVDRNTIVQDALSWSKTVDPAHPMGSPSVHKVFADALWDEKQYRSARYHFLWTTDGSVSFRFLKLIQSVISLPDFCSSWLRFVV